MNPNRVWHRMQFLQNVTPNKVKEKKPKQGTASHRSLCLQLPFLSKNQPHREARTSRASRTRGRQAHALLCKALLAASVSLMLQGQLCEGDTVVQIFPGDSEDNVRNLTAVPHHKQLQWVLC